MQKVKKRLFS